MGLSNNYWNAFRFILYTRRMGNRPVARTHGISGEHLKNIK